MFQFHFLNCSQITLISSPRWRRTWLRRAGWAAGRGGPAPRSSRWRWRGWGRAWGTPQGPRPPPSCSSHPDWPSSLKYSSSNNLIMTLFSTGTAVLSTLCCCCVAWSLELCLVLNSRSRQGRRRLLPSHHPPGSGGNMNNFNTQIQIEDTILLFSSPKWTFEHMMMKRGGGVSFVKSTFYFFTIRVQNCRGCHERLQYAINSICPDKDKMQIVPHESCEMSLDIMCPLFFCTCSISLSWGPLLRMMWH